MTMHFLEDTSQIDPLTQKSDKNTGGRRWRATFEIGVRNAKRANDGKHHTEDLNSLQDTYLSNDRLRGYQWT